MNTSTAAQAQAVPCVKCGRWNPERCHYVSCPKWDDAIAQPATPVEGRTEAGVADHYAAGQGSDSAARASSFVAACPVPAAPIKPVFADKRMQWEKELATHAQEFDPRYGSQR